MKLARIVALVAVIVFALTLLVSAQVEHYKWKIDIPQDRYYTPTEFPCLTETIHVTGSCTEQGDFFVNPSGGLHYAVTQTTRNITAVGMVTGHTYQFSGPLTQTLNGSIDKNPDIPVEFTFHNIVHAVGPGPDSKIYFRTLVHISYDTTTGAVKAEISKDEVLCH